MFDLSWAEMAVVVLVGLLILGPEELPVVIRHVKNIVAKVKDFGREFTSVLSEDGDLSDLKSEMRKLNKDIQTIVDLDGNIQPTYDISDVMEESKARKKDNDQPSGNLPTS